METLRHYFNVLEDDGLLQPGSVHEYDIQYLYEKIVEEQKNREAELNVITQYQR